MIELLASQIGSIVLALLAGAGGSALLELIWRPRRAKRRVARLLNAEIAQNTQLLALKAAMARIHPSTLGPGFRLSRLVWDAATDAVPELPEDVLREVIALYSSYEEINRDAASIESMIDAGETRAGDDLRSTRIAQQVVIAMGVLNEQVIRASERGRVVSNALRGVVGEVGVDPTIKSDAEYEKKALQLIEQRSVGRSNQLPNDPDPTAG